jgi:5-methylcytosine rRNA methyltransferase NSUN4
LVLSLYFIVFAVLAPKKQRVFWRMPSQRRGTGKGGDPKVSSSDSSSKKKISFDAYYQSVYGSRWPALKRAMMLPTAKVAMWNRFTRLSQESVVEGLTEIPSELLRLCTGSAPAVSSGEEPPAAPSAQPMLLEQPPRDDFGTPAYYLLDEASTMIVEQMQVDGFHKVLDLCAAPGGKSIAIAQFLSPQGEIHSNEPNKDRAQRLKRNLHEHIPQNSCIFQVTQRDATTWYNPEAFDRVLVDAPCSSERHVMHQPGGTADWDLRVTHELAKTQGALLLRALEAVKVGGIVVYSTCSISPVENDEVVAYALERTRCHIELRKTQLRLGEATKLGWIVLPDTCPGHEGSGPMYCSSFVKVAAQRPLTESDTDSSSEESDA